MTLSRVLVVAVTVSGLLAGCSNGPTKIDASSQSAMQTSTAKIRADLPDDKQAAFTEALQVIATRDIADAVEKGGLLAAAASLPTDPEAMFQRVAEQVNGKTGDEIIAQAHTIKQERIARQKIAIEEQIAGLEKEIADAAAVQAAAATTLAKIKISGARYEWTTGGFMDGPVLDFSIENTGQVAIKRVYFHGLLETIGRSVPWVDDDFNYDFKGGLEPGETQHLRLDPNRYSDWGNSDLEKRNDLVLTLTVKDFENARSERAVGAVMDMDRKRGELEAAKEKLAALGG